MVVSLIFNPAFVGLMGRADIGPVNGKPAGLTAEQMEDLRQFVLGFRMPPNPNRNVDDTIANHQVQFFGSPFLGNPTVGQTNFHQLHVDAFQPCSSCHQIGRESRAGGSLGPDLARAWSRYHDQGLESLMARGCFPHSSHNLTATESFALRAFLRHAGASPRAPPVSTRTNAAKNQ